MNLLTDPVTKKPRQPAAGQSVQEWLDALATGTCDQATFLRSVDQILPEAPDAGWELLALVDQYFRRGRISADTFGTLKTHLQDLLMGKERRADDSVPPPRTGRDQPAAPAAPPAPISAVRNARPVENGPAPVRSHAPAVPVSTVVSISVPVPSGAQGGAGSRRRRPVPSPVAAPARDAITTPVADSIEANEGETKPAHQSPDRVPAIGEVLRNRYRIRGLLGQGGMGTVFEATDQYRLDESHGDQKVAVKILHMAVIQRPRLLADLQREFQILQSLSHPNIVRVHEFDRDGDLAFFTMEYLSGALLSRVLAAHESECWISAHRVTYAIARGFRISGVRGKFSSRRRPMPAVSCSRATRRRCATIFSPWPASHTSA